ncbi:putative Leucoanthocyanidin dioxygenase [Corchorus olitorius]|uniref:Leucoanthocyanidin dioxygenase n=1 Tax=Corchorus olitorius TaxID=93759 RepID=A0A1R3GZL0_9ROSI|nr:putative Leucoanthocyanidin dioxygenase [Corchorus olitorius]
MALISQPGGRQTPNIVDDEAIQAEDGIIPIIDFSLLTSTNPEERANTIEELGKPIENGASSWYI